MEENEFISHLKNHAEEPADNPKSTEAMTETAQAAAEWHEENDMGQFVSQTNTDWNNDAPHINPMKWEDTPLFSFMGRSCRLQQENHEVKNNAANNYENHVPNNSDDYIESNSNNHSDNNFGKTSNSDSNVNNPNNSVDSNADFDNDIYNSSSANNFKISTVSVDPAEFVLDGFTLPGILIHEGSPFDQTYKFVNMPLPYDYDALEPYIDSLTMHLHHDRHLRNYIDGLNAALAPYPRLHGWRLERLLQSAHTLPPQIRTAVINNGGGVYNHFFYFESLTNRPELKTMPPALLTILTSTFKSVDNFKTEFKKKALSVFGSGYAWLVLTASGRLEITTTMNQDTPLTQRQYPLLNIDVWEHAYYLKHHNKRDSYVDNWFGVINWHEVERRLSEIKLRR